jgi:hypothetical protein
MKYPKDSHQRTFQETKSKIIITLGIIYIGIPVGLILASITISTILL